jgi:hypothetical protein
MQRKSSSRSVPPPFSEKAFYLQEFRGRSLGVALPAHALDAPEPLLRVLDELAANGTKVIVISTSAASLETALGPPILSVETPRLEGAVWRALAKASRVGVAVECTSRSFARFCANPSRGTTRSAWRFSRRSNGCWRPVSRP